MNPASPPVLHLRPLTAADVPVCVDIYCRAYELPEDSGGWDEATAGRVIRDLLRLFPDQCFVAERDAVVPGFILCSSLAGVRATIEEFAVAPEYQNQGVGSALLDYVLDFYRRRGLPLIELVANRHTPAHAFYRKRGFSENRAYRLMGRTI
jgi:ribosomal protein S18 acetylase RimI-like enzyme